MVKLLKTPAPWYRAYLKRIREAVDNALDEDDLFDVRRVERDFLLEQAYLKDSIKLVRKFVKGFESKDGVSLKHIGLIPQRLIDEVKKYAPQIRAETAHISIDSEGNIREHFKLLSPRSDSRRIALAEHTGQNNIRNRKTFVLHTDRPDSTTARFITETKTIKDRRGVSKKEKKTRVEIEVKIKNKIYMERFFYFNPAIYTIHDAIEQTRKMLPKMPNGYYTFVSSRYGDIMGSMSKGQILYELQTHFIGYDKFDAKQGEKDNRGFAETFRGYRFVSNRFEGARREMKNKDSNLLKFKRARDQNRSKLRKAALKTLKGL